MSHEPFRDRLVNRVARSFTTIVAPAVSPAIQAFTDQQFQDMGVRPFQAELTGIDTLEELVAFSTSIESWHNTAHTGIGTATGTPMMDPRQNIFFAVALLHRRGLRDHDPAAVRRPRHPGQFVIGSAVAAHIEARHHGWVPRI